MANANATAVQAIKTAAAKYGLDPAAMIAVSRVESGLNPRAVGDGGHAFGLFQFNNAGGIITGDPNPGKYLDPNYNAMEAARHIASIKGARQARGADAVRLIVNNFERPANKGAEISKALSYLTGAPSPTISTSSKPPSINSQPSLASSNGNPSVPAANPLQSLLQYAMQGSSPGHDGADTNGSILNLLTQPVDTMPVPTVGNTNSAPPPVSGTPGASPNTTQALPQGDYGKVTSLPAKIIGTPGKGTHAKAFNAASGSDNWESENAVDIALPKGTPLYAAVDGTIGNQIGSLGSGGRFAGLRVHLDGKDNSLYYAHLSKLAVKAGQQVKKGQLIGYSGEANGVQHLHLASKSGNPGVYA